MYGKQTLSHNLNVKMHFFLKNRCVNMHVWKCLDTLTALVTICAGFLSCCATGSFLDAAALVVGLDPISVCLHLANRCSTKWTQFSELLPSSSLGIKICTPANKPWDIWWRTAWAIATLDYIQYRPLRLLNTVMKKCKLYLDCEVLHCVKPQTGYSYLAPENACDWI